MIQFDLPKEQSSILKVIGIGGGGGNAVNHMFSQSIEGVNFIICNTDSQALSNSSVPNKIQLGPNLTQGLGAGANPEIGREATEESLEEIRRILEVNTKMAFITAGMGGGTGTGGAPIVAKICKDLGILTVGIVTTPFTYEGKKRMIQAQSGIENLKDHVDTLLVISNDKLRHQFGNLTMKAAFAKADNVLATAAKCITDVINSTGQINVDFADVCTVMRNGGVAILGSAECEGEDRAQKAIEQALNSPLLNDNDISGAKWILININSAEGEHEFTMDEVDTIQTYLLSKAGESSDVILGLGYDSSLGDKISITLIATGFEDEETRQQKKDEKPEEPKIEKEILELKPTEKKAVSQPLFLFDQQDEAATIRQPEPEIVEEKTGLRKDKVLEALVREEDTTISKEMKPEIIAPEPETKKSILDVTFGRQEMPVVKPERNVVFFELAPEPDNNNKTSSSSDSDTKNESERKENRPALHQEKVAVSPPSSGRLPGSPSVYVERAPVPGKKPAAELSPLKNVEPLDSDNEEMKLVEKSTELPGIDDEEKKVYRQMPVIPPVSDEPGMQDEADDQKRRALDRIARLRNLSFNQNATEAHDDFESVPAYLRRNLELHNSIANVENFYKNCTVGTDENSKFKIGSINTYLDGKKPD